MTHSLILFNGPPGSGKDECARHMYKRTTVHWFRYSQPIKDGIRAMFALTEAEYADAEKKKDEPSKMFFGKTFREVQISFSEQWAKVFFSNQIFGHLALRRVKKSISTVFVCSDSGFATEVEPFFQHFHKDDVLLIKLHRPGKSFSADSRNYIDLPGVMTIKLNNDASLNTLFENVDMIVTPWLDRYKDKQA